MRRYARQCGGGRRSRHKQCRQRRHRSSPSTRPSAGPDTAAAVAAATSTTTTTACTVVMPPHRHRAPGGRAGVAPFGSPEGCKMPDEGRNSAATGAKVGRRVGFGALREGGVQWDGRGAGRRRSGPRPSLHHHPLALVLVVRSRTRTRTHTRTRTRTRAFARPLLLPPTSPPVLRISHLMVTWYSTPFGLKPTNLSPKPMRFVL